jgi:hypothetical protein
MDKINNGNHNNSMMNQWILIPTAADATAAGVKIVGMAS